MILYLVRKNSIEENSFWIQNHFYFKPMVCSINVTTAAVCISGVSWPLQSCRGFNVRFFCLLKLMGLFVKFQSHFQELYLYSSCWGWLVWWSSRKNSLVRCAKNLTFEQSRKLAPLKSHSHTKNQNYIHFSIFQTRCAMHMNEPYW